MDLFKDSVELGLDKQEALRLVRALWNGEGNITEDEEWAERIDHFSRLCLVGLGKTHVAMLGTAILAKAVNPDLNLFVFKPEHAGGAPNAYSARTLCHEVLVPLAAELGFHLGATGREPLNNQPYFRMERLDDGTPVKRGSSLTAFRYMMGMIKELNAIRSQAALRRILLAFLRVRARYQPRYSAFVGGVEISPEELIEAIQTLVRDASENGKRAQAVAAGLFDVFAGPDNIVSGRINDPSRKLPGDVQVRSPTGESICLKAVEVRDKPVKEHDVRLFAQRCADFGVREVAVLMVASRQERLDAPKLSSWADQFGIGLTLFHGWPDFTNQVLYWSDQPKPLAAAQAVQFIHQRLIDIEAAPEAVDLWTRLTSGSS